MENGKASGLGIFGWFTGWGDREMLSIRRGFLIEIREVGDDGG